MNDSERGLIRLRPITVQDEVAQAAAKWWTNQLRGLPDTENDFAQQLKVTERMANPVAGMNLFERTRVRMRSRVSDETFEKFEMDVALAIILGCRYELGMGDDRFRSDYGPDRPPLLNIAQYHKIPNELFPWKTVMYIWDNMVQVDRKVIFQTVEYPEFIRASGDCPCDSCGREYRRHSHNYRWLDNAGQPWLRLLCDGSNVKL